MASQLELSFPPLSLSHTCSFQSYSTLSLPRYLVVNIASGHVHNYPPLIANSAYLTEAGAIISVLNGCVAPEQLPFVEIVSLGRRQYIE